jgi:hypothetical protein
MTVMPTVITRLTDELYGYTTNARKACDTKDKQERMNCNYERNYSRASGGFAEKWLGEISAESGVGVDNVKRAIVWCDEIHNDLADDADDAHEKGMDVVSPNLIGADEIGLLRYPELCKLWFGGKYSDEVLAKIGEATQAVVFPNIEDDPDFRAFVDIQKTSPAHL